MNKEIRNETADRLSQLSQFLTYRISRLHAKLNVQASRLLKDSVGISLNQWRILAFIGASEKLSASELIAYTAMDKGMVSRKVKSLIQAGLVVSSADEVDQRVHVLGLTPAGKQLYDVALPLMRGRQAHLKSDISPQDIETFYKVMEHLEKGAERTDFL